ncbi:tRNA pseudouridine(13) synthase TruD, partial [Candidatus Woesearchaeota archaeon]|nr:tRNA pseudouridine(13) synthase TruD [Candidatus Woesearchaeota archaeon]
PAGKGTEPLYLGCHEGNDFKITVRNLSEADLAIFKKNCDEFRANHFRFTNYFDSQRFSSNNAEVGKLLLKKDFRKAAELISGYPEIASHLEGQKNDYVGALKELPKKTLMLYVHSYQSLLWNRMAEKLSGREIMLPLIGFGTEINDESIAKMAEEVLKEEGITQRDFIIRQLPVSAEGSERSLSAAAKDFKASEAGEDELNKGMSKIILSFSLQKGSYATIVVKNLFQPK